MYARKIGETEYIFGVSGLPWNDNVLMYDHQTESLWSQAKREAVAGLLTGTRLRMLPSVVTSWSKWRRRHPDTQVLSLETGYQRDYSIDPYESYYRTKTGLFSRFRPGPGEEAKELVAGTEVDGIFKVYPLERLRTRGKMEDVIGDRKLVFVFDFASVRAARRDATSRAGSAPSPRPQGIRAREDRKRGSRTAADRHLR